jgi:hydrogenase maturation protein HypF
MKQLTTQRYCIRVTGVVQGVGFRPFVYGLALRFGLVGVVGNDSSGVFIEVEGEPTSLDAFTQALRTEAPPLAHIETVDVTTAPPQHTTEFVIVHSQAQSGANTLVSPDLCTCDDCLRELLDPANRRYRYPFINCTNCGPRFTIIADIPYDRPKTTMAAFPMCPACEAEYTDPLDRRFHAQPNACPECGPHVWLEVGEAPIEEDAITEAQRMLRTGQIVAVKGLGGFHLACDATNPDAVTTLRKRKHRQAKPLAVMVGTLPQAEALGRINAGEAQLLTSRERPIVLVPKRQNTLLADGIAPGNPLVGLMLPYTPLHTLLLEGMPPLIMTSGNISGEPIIYANDAARESLKHVADAFLLNDRDIHTRCDDSVMRVWAGTELPVRRSRGYAPFPVRLPHEAPTVLATGGELKATFCLTKGRYAFMSQHLGDMENFETLHAFNEAVAHFQQLFRVTPQAIAADIHPSYLSVKWANEQSTLPVIPVQHHHAHIAAVMAEHGHTERVIGFSFDGTGYGTDGAIWGGEVLLADFSGFTRAYHLAYVPLPGGDAAVKRPYRTGLAHLHAAGLPWGEDLPAVAACPPTERAIVQRQLERGLNAPPTSSIGRLFDAVASLIGVRQHVHYEGQAAIELEALAAAGVVERYTFAITANTFDAAPVIKAIVGDLQRGVGREVIAAKFHNSLAHLIEALSLRLRQTHQITTVALSGGVFQNATLLGLVVPQLHAHGFETLIHRVVPPNDGGLALGQAIIASHTLGE